jgi:hypothetical protein
VTIFSTTFADDNSCTSSPVGIKKLLALKDDVAVCSPHFNKLPWQLIITLPYKTLT